MNWLRWYVGTVTDAKLHKTSRLAHCRRSAVIAAWAAILEEARRHGDSGEIGTIDPSWLASQIDEPLRKCEAILAGMLVMGLITETNVTAFSRRQFTSDCSTVRVQRHRSKLLKTNDSKSQETLLKRGGETPPEQTQSQKVDSRILPVPPEPRTETPPNGAVGDLDALYYHRGKALLGHKAGGQLTKLRSAMGSVGAALQVIDDASHKDCPAEYVAGVIRKRGRTVETVRADDGRWPGRAGI